MKWNEYCDMLFAEKTAKRYKKLGNTLLHSKDRQAHIDGLSKSSQVVYRTALKHVEQYERLFKTVRNPNHQVLKAQADKDTIQALQEQGSVKWADKSTDKNKIAIGKAIKSTVFKGDIIISNDILSKLDKNHDIW